MSSGIGHRHGSDPAAYRLAAATLIGSLAWELPYAVGIVLKCKSKKKKKKKKKKKNPKNFHFNKNIS